MDRPTIESLDLVFATDAVPHPAWLCDDRGRLIHANDRWLRYFGNESALRPHWLTDRFIHAHDVERVRDAWHEARRDGTDLDVELRLRRFDGDWRWHRLLASPTTGVDSGRAWFGTTTDVHVHVERERTLSARSELLAAQVEASLDAIIVVSTDRRLIWANGRAYELWGLTPDEAPPGTDMQVAAIQTALQVTEPGDHMRTVERMYAEPDQVLHDQVEMVDGRTMERYSAPVVGADGTLLGRVNTYRDVTENRQLLAELQDRARAAVALNYVADAVIQLDPNDVVHLWNPAAEQLTGVTASDALGRDVASVLPGWDAVRARIPVFRSGEARKPPATLPLERTTTGEAWVSALGVRFDEGTVFALRDVTDDRRLDRMRSDIVATVSHELRTPLTSIYGMAITLQRSDDEIDPITRRQLLDMVVDQAARLGEIIEDILVASSIDAGSLAVRTTPVDAAAIARGAADLVARDIPPEVDLTVDVSVDTGGSVMAVGDPDRAQQVLVNLLENAIKYSPGGGTIGVLVEATDGEVLVHVSDQGLGIPTSELDHVFEKFHRLDPRMMRGIAGTGLGLYIARELARRMDGDVTVQSAPGRGSTFTLHLRAT